MIVNIRGIALNLAVVVASGVIGVLLCELGLRLLLNRSDYLSVEMVSDEILGAVPSANTASGFDTWGFRNSSVPETTDIVAIGDSHTYGNTATMKDSWPYVLGSLTGRRVYNMGLGGYGPNQYYHLFITRALKLKPQTIIVGLYMGDDFENAFSITYGLEHWAYLRALTPTKAAMNIWETQTAPKWHKRIRVWLSRHSIAYQLLFHGSLLGHFQGEIQIQNANRLSPMATSLNIPDKGILEAFIPEGLFRRLDQDSEQIREGMRITFELLSRMNDLSHEHDIEFLVVIIPTKEMVFAEYVEHKPQLPLVDVINKLLANERLARQRTFKFLSDAGIRYVDALPVLRRSVNQKLYARTAADMHPSRNGYRVIAEAILPVLASRGEAHSRGAGGEAHNGGSLGPIPNPTTAMIRGGVPTLGAYARDSWYTNRANRRANR